MLSRTENFPHLKFSDSAISTVRRYAGAEARDIFNLLVISERSDSHKFLYFRFVFCAAAGSLLRYSYRRKAGKAFVIA